jgi:hypothetical protein
MFKGRKIHINLHGYLKKLDNSWNEKKSVNVKEIFGIKFAYVTNDTAGTSIKNHICYYTMTCETVICDSDGVTDDRIPHW